MGGQVTTRALPLPADVAAEAAELRAGYVPLLPAADRLHCLRRAIAAGRVRLHLMATRSLLHKRPETP